MTTKVASSPTMEAPLIATAETKRPTEQPANGVYTKNRSTKNRGSLPNHAYPVKRSAKNKRPARPRPPLPTFSLEVGYRGLGEQPMYETIVPDPDGRITFIEVGLQFEVVGRERINIYDLTTGERLLTPAEQKTYADSEAARAKQEATRADNEAAARTAAEARIRELEALLRQAGVQP